LTNNQAQKPILFTAWVTILTIALFKIILQEIFHFKVSENLDYGISAAILMAGFGLTFAWKAIRPLRPFFGLFIVLVTAKWFAYTQVEHIFPIYDTWLRDPSFNVSMLAEKFLNLVVTIFILAFLFILKKKRTAFFLAVGDTSAAVEPVKWLGVKTGEKWNTLGRLFAIILSLGTLTFLVIAGRPPLDIVIKALPFLPVILLAAVLNAFTEEINYKASFLSVLEDVVGKHQALWLMAAYFGIWHFYGVPYGVIGVILAGFLGWLLGKSMLETRGLFWAWFLHFVQDVFIFAFLAIGAITPGG
jgi:membrane protease YdiL (CAAX protease family)